jgi:dolichol kinase
MAAKMTGLRFGRIRIIQDKTLEGSLAFLAGCLYTGFILSTLLNIEFSYLIIGACVASVVELFSYHMDDNFTVGILTGGCLMALKYFQVIP